MGRSAGLGWRLEQKTGDAGGVAPRPLLSGDIGARIDGDGSPIGRTVALEVHALVVESRGNLSRFLPTEIGRELNDATILEAGVLRPNRYPIGSAPNTAGFEKVRLPPNRATTPAWLVSKLLSETVMASRRTGTQPTTHHEPILGVQDA